jgi:DNA primase
VPLRCWCPEGKEGAEQVLVCEGEGDLLAALSALAVVPASAAAAVKGLRVVSVPGTATPAERVAEELAGVGFVFLSLDNDEAGRKATRRYA